MFERYGPPQLPPCVLVATATANELASMVDIVENATPAVPEESTTTLASQTVLAFGLLE